MTAAVAADPVRLDATTVLDQGWDVDPRVSIRPESFGALLYHFGTRRLSFLKDRRLLDVVQRLPQSATAREACLAVGLSEAELATYGRSLATLVATDMLVARRPSVPGPGDPA
ncbi:MAG: mftB [Frankiales bacterium]|nr:mftB [Frankiales bacterium]